VILYIAAIIKDSRDLLSGQKHKHKGRVITDKVKAFLVEDI
jgi:hypothetical protein